MQVKIKDTYYPIITLFISITIGLGIISYINAQTDSIDKTFTKCGTETSLLDSLNLSYDKACNEEYITIHNWQDVLPTNQQLIITDMTSKGFNEVIVISNVTVGESK